MLKKTGWLSAGLTLAAFSAVTSFALGSVGSAQAAVVYCKTVGVPNVLIASSVVSDRRASAMSAITTNCSPVSAPAEEPTMT